MVKKYQIETILDSCYRDVYATLAVNSAKKSFYCRIKKRKIIGEIHDFNKLKRGIEKAVFDT